MSLLAATPDESRVAGSPGAHHRRPQLASAPHQFVRANFVNGGVMNFDVVDHISYSVVNLDRSVEFYTTLLNEEPFLRKTWDEEYAAPLCGYERVILEGAFWRLPQEQILEILEFKMPKAAPAEIELYRAGSSHLGLACADVRGEFERLRAAGVKFQSSEVVEIPWGPYKGGMACFARDPDGIFIELIQAPPGGVRLE